MPTANVTLNVQGEAVGIVWKLITTVQVEDPAGSGNWRRANLSEVVVRLYKDRFWLPDVFLVEGLTRSDGTVHFDGTYVEMPAGAYKVAAEHRASFDTDGVKLELRDDGTFEITGTYKP